MVDQHRAVLFGGLQPGLGEPGLGEVNDVYLFDFRTMVSWNRPFYVKQWNVRLTLN